MISRYIHELEGFHGVVGEGNCFWRIEGTPVKRIDDPDNSQLVWLMIFLLMYIPSLFQPNANLPKNSSMKLLDTWMFRGCVYTSPCLGKNQTLQLLFMTDGAILRVPQSYGLTRIGGEYHQMDKIVGISTQDWAPKGSKQCLGFPFS